MIERYYERELANLRDLAADFSRQNPALAPMLGGSGTDPDVERLLEGVAFLVGMAKQKLDDGFPEFIQELARILFPHYLRPIPSATVLVFSATGKLNEPAHVPAGVEIASVPVEGTECSFRTCYDVEVHPLVLSDARLARRPGAPTVIRLSFELSGVSLAQWRAPVLRLHLGGTLVEAAKLFLILSRYLTDIVVGVPGGAALSLPPDALKPVGFLPEQAVLPYPPHAYPGYRSLQEYFVLPEKFLFLDLEGLDRWGNRGPGGKFDIEFRLRETPDWMPEVRRDSVVLFATPAINLFPFDATPVLLDHRRHEYPVLPASPQRGHYDIYSIDSVVGYRQGVAGDKRYYPYGLFAQATKAGAGVYQAVIKPSVLPRGSDVHISVAYVPGEVPQDETLSIRLTCTNGGLPESLLLGDISRPTGSSPERLAFRNIRPPTAYQPAPAGEDLLWRVLSHVAVNFLSLATAETLKALLHLYVFSERHDRGLDVANRKRIEGIIEVKTAPGSRLVSGLMIRGTDIRVRCRQDHFAGQGDLFLFGCVLDQFLGCYAALNSYTRFELEEVVTGEVYRWPERIGQQPLL